jgi:hypothetical protein
MSSLYTNKEKDEYVIVLEDGGHRLRVNRNGDSWSLKISHADGPTERETAWATLKKPEGLRTSPNAKQIRESYGLIFGAANTSKKIDDTIDILQTESFRWPLNEESESSYSEEDKGADLIRLAKANAAEFFRDQYQTGYAVLRNCVTNDTNDTNLETRGENTYTQGVCVNPDKDFKTTDVTDVSDAFQTVPLKSREFKWWIAGLYHDQTGKTVGNDSINAAILVLESETQTKPMHYLYNRIAPNGHFSLWWDMADSKGRAIHLDSEGWRIEPSPPKLFRRYSHMNALPEPVKGGDLTPFLNYLNLEEPGDKLLAIVSVISYLIPEVPKVGTVVTGVQGSGKSAWHRFTQTLLDPSSTDLLTLPSKDDDLIQILEHHAVAIFDNVNQLTRTQSDILCRTITGIGNEKRELYTTDDSFIRSFMRIVGLNGISMPVEKGDLFSRMILLPWEPITDRKTDAEMKAQMKRDAPQLIGAMLDTLVKAMRFFPDVKTGLNVRMSDFAKWGCAITMALGLKQTDFERAYRENIKSQDEEAVRASMVAEMIIRYMRTQGESRVEGSATDLKKLIEVFENPPDFHGKPTGDLLSRREGWPKNATRFGRELAEIAPSLIATGYRVATPKKGRGRSRNYVIERVISIGEKELDKGQRSFETTNLDELTDARLRAALVGEPKSVEFIPEVISEVMPEVKTVSLGEAREALLGRVELRGDGLELEAALEFLGKLGLNVSLATKVIGSMMRDGVIFSPRAGWYKAT